MKIRTQFIINITLFGLMLLIISASLIKTNRETAYLERQVGMAADIERTASELSYLSHDYLLHRESQQRTRWETKFDAFSSGLANLKPDRPEVQAVVDNIKGNLQRLRAVFNDVASSSEGGSPAPGAGALPSLLQISWIRMAVQNQGIFFDTSRLSQLLRERTNQLKQRHILLVFTLLGFFGIYFVANYFLLYRHVLRSLSVLQAGATVIGSGNLDYIIAVRSNDEIGELSRAFNRMTADLKSVTTSKAELEREIDERLRIEENLKRRTAELEAANRELEAFSYSVSHDLRAPLRHIDGFSRMLLTAHADQLDDRGKEYLRKVRESTHKMGQLIDDLLNLSRVTRAEICYEPVELSAMAQLIADELGKEGRERRAEFIIGPGATASGDGQLLRIALENLLGNAWKFTSKCAAAKIEFGMVRQDGQPVFYVRDNGVGFDMAYAGKLFGAFERLHDEGDFPGTGIGLATVQRIIHRHGGQVWAESEAGRGATFYFTLD